MRSRKRARSYRNSRPKNGKLNFTPVIVILCLSVGCGYATAKYVVEPAVNYVPQLTAEEEMNALQQTTGEDKKEKEAIEETEKVTDDGSDVIEDDVSVEDTRAVAGYALQFGCYSGKGAAEAAMKAIGMEGLQILEQDQMYKIIGKMYDSKEKATAALKELPDTAEAFVTVVYK